MKKNIVIIVLAVMVIGLSAFIVQDQRTAKMEEFKGYHVYVFSTPNEEYEIVDQIKPFRAGVAVVHVEDLLTSFVTRAKQHTKRTDEEVHGIIYEENGRGKLIRFKK